MATCSTRQPLLYVRMWTRRCRVQQEIRGIHREFAEIHLIDAEAAHNLERAFKTLSKGLEQYDAVRKALSPPTAPR